MEEEFKNHFLLLALYEKRYDGKFYDVAGLFSANNIDIAPVELMGTLEALGNEHLVKSFFIGERYLSQITMDGIEFLEENNFFDQNNYAVRDRIKPLQREILRHKLDDFTQRICRSDIGAKLNQDEFIKEAEELKMLLNILGRKNWMQMLKGKFYELCQGNVPLRRLKKIMDIFESKQMAEEASLTNQIKETASMTNKKA